MWGRRTPETPAMASCVDGLLLRSLHGWCQEGSWAHHTQKLTKDTAKTMSAFVMKDTAYGCIYVISSHFLLVIEYINSPAETPRTRTSTSSIPLFMLKTWFIVQSYLWAADQMVSEAAWEGSRNLQMVKLCQ